MLPEPPQVVSEVARCEFLRQRDDRYPASLTDLAQPPGELFWLGDLNVLHRPAVSIVGTRDSTSYGERTARNLSRDLVRAGVCVVSGMARGIDATAHRSALENGGATIAVLGTGIDVAYPAGHRPLHAAIAAHGLVLSENPPGASAQRGSFPKRNRIIAALGRITVVVEAGHKSGALNTASHALDLGRVVAAVPGQIDSEQSAGANQLIRDGAVVITSSADLLALLGLAAPPTERTLPSLPDVEQRVWEAVGFNFTDSDAVGLKTGLAPAECLAAITSLELMGLVECSLAGEIRRR
ncbi:MAG: DNA-processing protein DprA [Gemmatimonadota bacterium]|nr:DNA-processing protein DprA [Gemmatimonadota bacterium]